MTQLLDEIPLRQVFAEIGTRARTGCVASRGAAGCNPADDFFTFTVADAVQLGKTVRNLTERFNIMHMDLNLDNVFMGRDNGKAYFKLIDFGRVVSMSAVELGFDLMDYGWSSESDEVKGIEQAIRVSATDIFSGLDVLGYDNVYTAEDLELIKLAIETGS